MAIKKRLIDANALMERLKFKRKISEVGLYRGLESAMAQCAKAPTVDAVEVVHGHWVSLTECSNAGVYCSVCQKKVYKEDYAWANRKNKLRSNYCPNCGAKMDGDGNG